MTKKLKPCPFCGGKASIDEIPPNPFLDEDEPYMWAVGCPRCNIGWYEETEAEAIATWNRRAAPEITQLWMWPTKKKNGYRFCFRNS